MLSIKQNLLNYFSLGLLFYLIFLNFPFLRKKTNLKVWIKMIDAYPTKIDLLFNISLKRLIAIIIFEENMPNELGLTIAA